MDDICRLCCSSNFVNNNIFDEENALYLKMSLYLPIKVFKNDRLPQKICDKCSCKVNDFYQFCNETIEVQNRLRAVLISTAVEIEDSIDLTLIKQNHLSPPPNLTEIGIEHKPEPNPEQKPEPFAESLSPSQSTYTVQNTHELTQVPVTVPVECDQSMEPTTDTISNTHQCDQSTQTDDPINDTTINEINIDVPLFQNVKIKEEPKQSVPPFKMEDGFPPDNYYCTFMSEDDAHEDNISLVNFQKKKRSKRTTNGDVDTKRKKKPKLKEWEYLMRSLPEGTALTVVDRGPELQVAVKQEPLGPSELTDLPKKVKMEPVEFHCCICFVQCYSRSEMLQHYKEHAAGAEQGAAGAAPPAPPPPPDHAPLKCMRCMKTLEARTWAAHWLKHWERDRRPYRCALCEKTFRDHHQILKHGLTHKWGEDGADTLTPPDKRFVCDLCPEGFHYMRYLLSHRTRAHPEAATRALALRCAVCARQFAHLNSLRRHLRAHSGERNFLCNICGKALSSREHLKFHIRIHTGYKPNICKTCGKGFVKKCNLTLHERVHSGEKPHVCSHCGKAFSQRSTLVIHERYHSGARPYACALCGRGFVAKGLLSMHLKTTCI